jgi:hypothetical protein
VPPQRCNAGGIIWIVDGCTYVRAVSAEKAEIGVTGQSGTELVDLGSDRKNSLPVVVVPCDRKSQQSQQPSFYGPVATVATFLLDVHGNWTHGAQDRNDVDVTRL